MIYSRRSFLGVGLSFCLGIRVSALLWRWGCSFLRTFLFAISSADEVVVSWRVVMSFSVRVFVIVSLYRGRLWFSSHVFFCISLWGGWVEVSFGIGAVVLSVLFWGFWGYHFVWESSFVGVFLRVCALLFSMMGLRFCCAVLVFGCNLKFAFRLGKIKLAGKSQYRVVVPSHSVRYGQNGDCSVKMAEMRFTVLWVHQVL